MIDINRLRSFEAQLREKVENLKKCDEEILELASLEADEETCIADVRYARAFHESVTLALFQIGDILRAKNEKRERRDSVGSGRSNASGDSKIRKIRAKLPKLETKKFNGNVCEWQEFWDAFESAIHQNDELSEVDKFAYLRHLVVEPARTVIYGFRLTAKDAKPEVIRRAHIHELAHTSVVGKDDVKGLRSVYNKIEKHFRALEAMAVDMATYSSIIVPVIMEKLAKPIRMNLICCVGKGHLTWSMVDLLDALKQELEIMESDVPLLQNLAISEPKTVGTEHGKCLTCK